MRDDEASSAAVIRRIRVDRGVIMSLLERLDLKKQREACQSKMKTFFP
jgi:hypothetical protein